MQKIDYFGRKIDLNEIYFIAFSDHPREMTDKELSDYKYIKALPGQLSIKEMHKLDPQKNPAFRPVTGRELIDITATEKRIPQFDPYFNKKHPNKYISENHKLTLMPAEATEFFMTHSQILNS